MLTTPTVFAALAARRLRRRSDRSFTVSMLFGVLVGTYSSIFVAAPILHYLGQDPGQQAEAPLAEKRADGAAV